MADFTLVNRISEIGGPIDLNTRVKPGFIAVIIVRQYPDGKYHFTDVLILGYYFAHLIGEVKVLIALIC